MLRKNLLFLIICTCCMVQSRAQLSDESEDNHTVYVELGSSTIATSLVVNYEPRFFKSKNNRFQLNGRMGLGVGLNHEGDYTAIHGGLGGLTMLFGMGRNRFAASGGWIVGWESMDFGGDARSKSLPLIEMGWRYENPEKNFMTKASIGSLGLSLGVGFTF